MMEYRLSREQFERCRRSYSPWLTATEIDHLYRQYLRGLDKIDAMDRRATMKEVV